MADSHSTPSAEPLSCRSEEGITVGLVDALIAVLRVLAPRDLSAPDVQEALADLLQDPDLRTVQDAAEPHAPPPEDCRCAVTWTSRERRRADA